LVQPETFRVPRRDPAGDPVGQFSSVSAGLRLR
jgi:hypothetical protein